MSHENKGLRISGDVYIERLGETEQPVIGPLAAEYVGSTAQADRKTVLDTRRNRRGQVLFAITDPKEPTGKLTLLSAPSRVIAMAWLGTEITVAQTAGTVTGEVHPFVEDYGIQLDKRNIGSVVLTPGVAATYATGVEGNNNGITWTAKVPGTAGNSITVALINPAGNDKVLGVVVTGTDIVVNLATSGAGAITSTAAQVIAAIRASTAASALVTVANTGASTGAAAVVADAEDSLAGGTAGGTPWVAGTDYEVLDAEEGIIRVIEGGGMGASGYVAVAYTHGTIAGDGVSFGTDNSIRARIVLVGTNDTDANAEKVRVEWFDSLLTPSGEVNLVATDPVKVEMTLTPLTPANKTYPVELSYPVFGTP